MNATQAQALYVIQQDLEDVGVPEALASLWASAASAASDADSRLLDAASSITDRVERVVRYVQSGSAINSLGELQGSAPQFDILCAQRQDAHQNVTRVEYAIRRAYPQADALLDAFGAQA